jgi:hypothetical protein
VLRLLLHEAAGFRTGVKVCLSPTTSIRQNIKFTETFHLVSRITAVCPGNDQDQTEVAQMYVQHRDSCSMYVLTAQWLSVAGG